MRAGSSSKVLALALLAAASLTACVGDPGEEPAGADDGVAPAAQGDEAPLRRACATVEPSDLVKAEIQQALEVQAAGRWRS